MIIVIILFILLVVGICRFDPYLDIFHDYRGQFHIVLWYTSRHKRKYERKYINIVGDQK